MSVNIANAVIQQFDDDFKDKAEDRQSILYELVDKKPCHGEIAYVDDPSLLPPARLVRDVEAPRSGYIGSLDAREIGLTAMLLGGGRAKKNDTIDHAVGIVLQAKIGDHVEKGQPLFTIHANDEARLPGARQRMLAAYGWSEDPVDSPPLIERIIH